MYIYVYRYILKVLKSFKSFHYETELENSMFQLILFSNATKIYENCRNIIINVQIN